MLALSFALTAVVALLPAFGLMLLMGILHSFYPAIPAIGYWLSYIIVLAVGCILNILRGGVKVDAR